MGSSCLGRDPFLVLGAAPPVVVTADPSKPERMRRHPPARELLSAPIDTKLPLQEHAPNYRRRKEDRHPRPPPSQPGGGAALRGSVGQDRRLYRSAAEIRDRGGGGGQPLPGRRAR